MEKRAAFEFDKFSDAVRSAVSEVSAILVGGAVQVPEQSSIPSVQLSATDAIKAIRHLRPKVVYMVQLHFDPAAEIDDAFDALENEFNDSSDDQPDDVGRDGGDAKGLLKRWQHRADQLCSVLVEFFGEGVLHTTIESAEWRDEFAGELEILMENCRSTISIGHDTEQKNIEKQINERAVQLAAHPAFNSGRVSFDKRLFLAKKMFPDAENEDLNEITTHAEKIDWLSKGSAEA